MSDLSATLKENSGRSGTGFRQNKARTLLAVSEIALAVVLLVVGAALLIRTSLALGDVRGGLEDDPGPIMYVPNAQVPDALNALNVRLTPLKWVVRTRGNPFALSAAIQEQLRQASGLPVSDVRTMDEGRGLATGAPRLARRPGCRATRRVNARRYTIALLPLSYSRGAAAPLLEKTISQALADTASRFPDREALVVCHQNARFTWGELDREATRVARGLAGLGLAPGDRAGIWASNCVEWILMQHAAARSGVVLVNVNPAYRSHELRYVLQKSRIRALFLRERDARADYRAILDESRSGEALPLEHVIWLGDPSWDAMLAGGRDFPRDSVTTHDVANIQYTSGTTGSPKGVLLSHHNLLNDGMAIGLALRATERDRICAPVPLYHCFGSVIGSMVSIVSGATLILPSAQFDALATLQAVHQERATALYGVPTMFIAELVHPDFEQFDLTSLRTGVMAGAPCPIEVMRTVAGRMHCPEMTIAYGQTESSPVITMSDVNDPMELRVTTVGAALANTEVQIVDPETGERVPIGQQGELCTRGYLVMKGYDDDPEATAAVIDREGWLHTGDLAAMRPDGYFSFRGRAKDTIIRGGENIYPREVEDFLHTHPKIADAYVIGIPDARLGETVLAWVQLKPGEVATAEEIQAFCKGTIAYFKVPQYVRFVDGFPMTVTKKIQKFLMREQEIRERGLEDIAGQATA